ncbi:MAG: AAA family ATPase [Bacteroidaceae bacterium]|nr:AAA family ATPase [Bacteroidaceae bacterium]
MRIDRVQLHNYRNYKDCTVDFGSEVTIFIGKNGAGKTNLIKAIKQLLSFVFSRRKDEPQFQFIASSDRNVISFKPLDARYGKDEDEGETEYNYHYPIVNTLYATLGNNERLNWTFEKDALTKGLKDSFYKKANLKFWKTYDNGKSELPVFAYFSDSYPHVNLQLSTTIKAMLESGNPLPRNAAYYKWDDDKNCTEIWLQYFIMKYKKSRLQNDEKATRFIDAIRTVLVKCSKPVSVYNPDMDIALRDILLDFRGKNEVVVVEYDNGTRIPFTELPTGYLRFFSIVLDIACRGYLLNENCNPDGIVLIDELDLHLHPSVERTILKRLRTTFTRIQWIVSTHSPLVLSAFEQKDGSNIIYKIYRNETEVVFSPIANMQGVDASSGLKYTMDTPDDDSRLNDYKEAYDFWKSKGDKEKMSNIKEMIKNVVGEKSLFYQMLK